LLQTKTEVPFDSTVESLSNAFFALYPLPILLVAAIYLLVPAVRSAESRGLVSIYPITKFAYFRNPAPTPLKTTISSAFEFSKNRLYKSHP